MNNRSLGVNAVLNGIKQGCSVVFPFLSFAYCSRIIGKEGIGIYSFSQSVVAYFILIAGLGIPNYAIREGATIRDEKEKVRTFLNQIYTINILSMLISYVLLFLSIAIIPKFSVYRLVMMILSLQLLLNTVGADWINSIYEDYLYLTVRYVVLQILSFVCLLIFVRDVNDLIPYTFITMLSNVGGNIINVIYLRNKNLYPHVTRNLNFNKHLVPIMILFANSIAGIIYLNSDITMLGFYLGESEVGVYTISSKIYSIIKTLINAVIMVTIPRFSYLIAHKKRIELKLRIDLIANVLLLISIPCAVGMIMEADKILFIVAGSGYESGEAVVKILAISMLFAVGACFFSYSILMPNKQEKEFMIATIIAALMNIILNFILIPRYGIIGTAITTLIAEVVVMGVTIYYGRNIMLPKIDITSLAEVIIGSASICGTCLFIDYHVKLTIATSLVLETTLSVFFYIMILFLLRNKFALAIINMIVR